MRSTMKTETSTTLFVVSIIFDEVDVMAPLFELRAAGWDLEIDG